MSCEVLSEDVTSRIPVHADLAAASANRIIADVSLSLWHGTNLKTDWFGRKLCVILDATGPMAYIGDADSLVLPE